MMLCWTRSAINANTGVAAVDEAATTPEAVILQNLLNVISRQAPPTAPATTKLAKPADPDSTLGAPLHGSGLRITACYAAEHALLVADDGILVRECGHDSWKRAGAPQRSAT